MQSHTRVYACVVNGATLQPFLQVEAISNGYINDAKRRHIDRKIKKGEILASDSPAFVLKYCFS